MATNAVRGLVVVAVLLVTLGACSRTAPPRGVAYQGVSSNFDRSALNAPYYTGTDPAYQRAKSSGGP